jgi:hypothetical protein
MRHAAQTQQHHIGAVTGAHKHNTALAAATAPTRTHGISTASLLTHHTVVDDKIENFTATDRASAQVEALSLLNALAFYDVDRNNHRNDLEPGVAEVTIQLHTPKQETWLANTNSNGQGIFTALPSGVYTVSVTAADLVDGYSIGAAVKTQAVTLTAAGVYTASFALTQSLARLCPFARQKRKGRVS